MLDFSFLHEDRDPFQWGPPEQKELDFSFLLAEDELPDEYFGFSRKAGESHQSWRMRMGIIDSLSIAEREAAIAGHRDAMLYGVTKALSDENRAARGFDEGPAKKKTRANHAARSAKYYTERGYRYERVESYNSLIQRSSDMLGIFDGIALGKTEKTAGVTLGVQICSSGDVSKRRRKMLASTGLHEWKLAGNRAVILSWKKVANRWVATEETL